LRWPNLIFGATWNVISALDRFFRIATETTIAIGNGLNPSLHLQSTQSPPPKKKETKKKKGTSSLCLNFVISPIL